MKPTSKKIVVFTVVSALFVAGSSMMNTAFAAEGKKNLEAFYKNIKIFYNSKQVAIDAASEPFILDGSTYIPLRYMGEVFGKEVAWDPTTNTITVADTEAADSGISDEAKAQLSLLNSEIQSLRSRLNAANSDTKKKEEEAAALQKQVDSLQKELDTLKQRAEVDLDDIEDELNDDYGDEENLDAKISLKGDEDDITVSITVATSAWDKLTSKNQESYVEDIVDDILKEAQDADITGSVKGKSDSRTLLTFYVDNDGDVVTEDFDELLADLEDMLNDDYGDYEGIDLEIALFGDEDDITIQVTVDEEEWDELSSSEKRALYNDLVDEVEAEFEDADVEGEVIGSGGAGLTTFS